MRLRVPKTDWTELEKEFDLLIRRTESQNQLVRIKGRLDMHEFVEQHGKEACDKMWERIK